MTDRYLPRHRRQPPLGVRQLLGLAESVTGYTGGVATIAAAITGDRNLLARAALLLCAAIILSSVSWLAYERTRRETP